MELRPALQILADGEFHSGEEIGQALGITRAGVWKQLSTLERLGLQVESRHGKGYCIAGGLDLLSEPDIRAGLAAAADQAIVKLEILLEVDSTNQRAMAQHSASLPYVCLAESQQAGRGRHGRSWVSPLANSIYLSVAWQLNGGAAVLQGLSLAVGVAVTRALRHAGITNTALKWPNDVVADGKKLGGILIELSGDIVGPCTVVIGIGLNGAVSPSSGEQIDIPWTDLSRLHGGSLPDRNQLAAGLLNELVALLTAYEEEGFSSWREEWQALDALNGRQISVFTGSNQSRGLAQGVDENGALLLQTETGVQSFQGGEVSLKANS